MLRGEILLSQYYFFLTFVCWRWVPQSSLPTTLAKYLQLFLHRSWCNLSSKCFALSLWTLKYLIGTDRQEDKCFIFRTCSTSFTRQYISINIAQLQMLHPCPLSISCRAGRSEGDKAAISRSTVATQPRGGESSQGKYFSAKKYIFTQNQNSRVFHNRKAFPIWWWWWIRTVEAQDCPVLAPLVSGNPTFRRCLANTRPIRPLHSHDPGDYHHRINHMSTTKDYI